jgi:hypothetical protein
MPGTYRRIFGGERSTPEGNTMKYPILLAALAGRQYRKHRRDGQHGRRMRPGPDRAVLH